MPSTKPTGFIPKWFRDFTPKDAEIDLIAGTVPDQEPRLVTRLIPKDYGSTLSAKTLEKVLELKQKLVLYAARDVVCGLNADFADLRMLQDPLTKFANLTIEPFESGSFVIPARLDAAPIKSEESNRQCDTEEVVKRFCTLLSDEDPKEAASVSMGALLAIKELGKLLDREVEVIEWTAVDRDQNYSPTIKLNTEKALQINNTLKKRQTIDPSWERVTGRLTSLDTITNAFCLSIPGQEHRAKGMVMAFHMPWMRERLGRIVELEGLVIRKKNSISNITVHSVIEDAEE